MKEIELLKIIKNINNHEQVSADLSRQGFAPISQELVHQASATYCHVYQRQPNGLTEKVVLFVTNNRYSQVIIAGDYLGKVDFDLSGIDITNYRINDLADAPPASQDGWQRHQYLSLRNSSHYEINVTSWLSADATTTRVIVEYNKRGEYQGSYPLLG